MENVYIALMMTVLFAAGYYIIRRFSRFVDRKQQEFLPDRSSRWDYAVYTGAESEEDIAAKAGRFRDGHGKSTVIVCLDSHAGFLSRLKAAIRLFLPNKKAGKKKYMV